MFLEYHRKLYYRRLGLQRWRAIARLLFRRSGLNAFDDAVDRFATRVWIQAAERQRYKRRASVIQQVP
ncbi:MAG: hypothetical protein ACR2JC_14820 [Chloroflexota bacterium]